MRKLTILLLITFVSCKESLKPNIKLIIENKVWIRDNFMNIPKYYSDGIEYFWSPKDHLKLKGNRLDLYLDGDSPIKPKENSNWRALHYYKSSNDTLFLQDMNDGDVYVRKIKIMKDTIIGILNYEKIQITALRKENDGYKKGLTYYMISKK